MSNYASKVVELARAQLGYKETGVNITKYSAYFEGTDFYNGSKGNGTTWGVEWCDIFVDWCFVRHSEWNRRDYSFVSLRDPQVLDVCFLMVTSKRTTR